MNEKWLAMLFVVCAGAAGCKQGIGERCQANDDCASDVCSMSSPKVCVTAGTNQTGIDAVLPDDAQPPPDTATDGP